jgi:glycosyltransferase involved in cell wall biosynthesis
MQNKFNLPYVIVFIAAYDEEEGLGETLARLKRELADEKYRDFYADLLVIDDGSTDKTAAAAKAAGVKVVSHPRNLGLGAATRTGMQTAFELGADIAVKVDADNQHDPAEIGKLIYPVLEGRADCVFGSRFLNDGGVAYEMPLHRSWGNAFFSRLASFMTGMKVTDSSTGYISFSKRYLGRFSILRNYNETQQLIIDSWGKGMRVIEVPVVSTPRLGGRSFITWRYPWEVIPGMLRSYIHVRPFKVFFGIGSLVFMLGVLTGCSGCLGLGRFFGAVAPALFMVAGLQIVLFGFLADIVIKKR